MQPNLNCHQQPPRAAEGWLSISLISQVSLSSSAMLEPHKHGHHTQQHKSTKSPPLMAADLSLFLFYPLVDLVIRLWKLENFIWVWEMRACRSMGFDMCPVEIVNVFSNRFLVWVVIFLVFVWIENLDFLRKFWMPKIFYSKYFGCWFCLLIIVLSFLGKFYVWLPIKCWDFWRF